MSSNIITNVMTPSLEVADGNVTFGGEWRLLFNGGRDFKFLDCVYYLNNKWIYASTGNSPGESDSWKVARRTFHPETSWKISSVTTFTRGVYEGNAQYGDYMPSPTLNVQPPNEPKIKMEVIDKDGGKKLHITVTPDDGQKAYGHGCTREVYRTWIEVRKYIPGRPGTYDIPGYYFYHRDWLRADSEEKTFEIDIDLGGTSEYPFECIAYSQGLAGDSPKASMSHYSITPPTPVIKGASKSNSSVILNFESGSWKKRPVDSIELQMLITNDDADAVKTGNYTWQQVGEPISDIFSSFCVPAEDILTEVKPGKHLYFRLLSRRDGLTSLSAPFHADKFCVPKMSTVLGAAHIFNAQSGNDGESVFVDVAWSANSITNQNANISDYKFTTEVSWGATEHAWQSSGGASDFAFDWENTELLATANANKPEGMTGNFVAAARVYIDGLTEGEAVYIKARRKGESDSDTDFGAYSNMVKVIPVTSPAWVRLTAPSVVARGESIALSWGLGTEAEQTGFVVAGIFNPQALTGYDSTADNSALFDANAKGILTGADSSGYAVINYEDIPADAASIALKVSATTGGLYKDSAWSVVRIVDAPTCSLGALTDLEALPLTLDVNASTGAVANIAIISRGVAYVAPDGEKRQFAGDVIWSGTGTGSIEITDAIFIDGCTYDVEVRATDTSTGLKSDIAHGVFTANFTNKAKTPLATLKVDEKNKYVTIRPIAPDGANDGDVCDIYRVTLDGAQLIAEGVEFGSSVCDRLAPYSVKGDGLSYRVSTRTKDGSFTWYDFPYQLKASGIRLDWQTSHVELPFNISISEGYTKDFESRKHMDGATIGYWSQGTEHKVSLSTDLVRFESEDQKSLLRDCAKYSGAVFIRTGAGHAFDANIEIDDIEESFDSGVVGISLKAESIKLTKEHMCQTGDIIAPAQPEPTPEGAAQ